MIGRTARVVMVTNFNACGVFAISCTVCVNGTAYGYSATSTVTSGTANNKIENRKYKISFLNLYANNI
jgi:hypothetical protein